MNKLTIERTNGGAFFLGCSVCGADGVWSSRTTALVAKSAHVCGLPTQTPGRLRPKFVIGPPASGQ